jgi:hypothetical protein
MRSFATYRLSRTALLAATLATGFYARGALAQDATGTSSSPPAGTPAGGAAPGGSPTTGAAPAFAAPPGESPAADKSGPPGTKPSAESLPKDILHLVEQMPPSAYPSPTPRVRGIYGGSLWADADFQGLQWPYYPKTGIGVSGSGWVDTGYRHFDAGQGLGANEAKGDQFQPASRFVLRTTPTWTDDRGEFFVQAQTELVGAKLTTSPGYVWGVDDAWIRFGKWKLFDILIGRFQAWEVYHYGMGLDLFTLERSGANDSSSAAAPQIYGLTYMYLRQDTIGQGAVHLYPTDWLRFEAGFQYGPDANGNNVEGVRPVGIAEWGPLRFKAGMEFLDTRPVSPTAKNKTRAQGYGAALQLVLDPYVEMGINGAIALNDAIDSMGRQDTANTNETWSAGGFINARVGIPDLLVGAGLNYTYLVDQRYYAPAGRNDQYDQWQPFGAVQYLLLKQLFIKFVFAYAKADMNETPDQSPPFKNEMVSGRLRFTYLF